MRNKSIARVEGLESRTLMSAGDFDPSFGNNGTAAITFTSDNSVQPRQLLQRTDGSLAAIGNLFNSQISYGVVGGFTSNGSFDTQFQSNPLPLAQSMPQVAAMQPDGKIVVVATVQNTSRDLYIYRLNTDGTIDQTFNATGQNIIDVGGGTDDTPLGVVIQKNGGIVIDGFLTPAGNPSPSVEKMFILRLTPTGPRDMNFAQGGLDTLPFMAFNNPLTLDAQDNILVSGILLNGSQSPQMAIARYTAEGLPDSTFDRGGFFMTNDAVGDAPGPVVVLSSGNILAADLLGGSDEQFIMLNPDGSLDLKYGTNGVFSVGSPGEVITSMAVDSAGRVVAGFGQGTPGTIVERFDPDAMTPDTTFGNNGSVTVSPDGQMMTSVVISPADNSIFVGYGTGSDLVITHLLGDSATGNPPSNPPTDPPSNPTTNPPSNPPDGQQNNNPPANPPSDPPDQTPVDPNGTQQPPENLTVDSGGGNGGTDGTGTGTSNGGTSDPGNGSQQTPPTNLIANTPMPVSPLVIGSTGQVAVFASYTGTTTTSVDANIFLSSDSIAGNGDDILIGHLDAVQIAPGTMGANIGTANVNIPVAVATGNYYIVEVLDPSNLVAESNETDNTAITPGPLPVGGQNGNGNGTGNQKQGGFNVDHLTATPNGVVAGSTFTLTATLSNTGTISLGQRAYSIYLSPGPMFQSNDILLGTVTFPAMDPGTVIPFTATLMVPANVVPAAYFISGIPNDPAIAGGDTGGTSKTPLVNVTAAPVKPGSLNSNFGTGGVAQNTVQDAFTAVDSVLDNRNRIVVLGTEANSGFVLLRFNTDGSLDTSFGVNGIEQIMIGPDDQASAITIDPNGKFVIAGTSNGNFAVLRCNPNGSPDMTFGTNGYVVTDLAPLLGAQQSTDVAKDIQVRGDGKIYVSGTTDARDAGDFAVARYNANGSLDNTFGSGGVADIDFGHSQDSANTIAIQADGFAVIAGSATLNGVVQIAAVRLTNNGALDPHFGTGGKITFTGIGSDSEINAVRTQADGKLVLGGFYSQGSASDGTLTTSFYLARLNTNGTLDTHFGSGGQVRTAIPNIALAAINNLVVTPAGKIVVAGKTAATLADAAAGNVGVAVAEYTAGGQLDTTFDHTGYVLLFQPTSDSGTSPAPLPASAMVANDLSSAFSTFTAAAAGLVNLTPGGGILALATSTTSSAVSGGDDSDDSSSSSSGGTTTVSIASIEADGADLVSSLSTALIPASVITGANGQVTLTVKNEGTLAIKGSVPLTLYLSTSSIHETGDYTLLTTKLAVNLSIGKSAKFTLKFKFPIKVIDGEYFIVADLNANDSLSELSTANDDSSSSKTTEVAKPFVDLSVAYAKDPSGTLADGKTMPVTLLIMNDGNLAARGEATGKFLAAPDDSVDSSAKSLMPFTTNINLQPGKSFKLSLKLKLTAGLLAPESAFLATMLNYVGNKKDTNSANNSIFSNTELTFG